MGISTEGLRAGEKEVSSATAPKGKRRKDRSEQSYVIDAALKTLKVLEALEGHQFEPVTILRVKRRTGFPYAFCRMALITLKKGGWAKQMIGGGWTLGPKAYNQASRLAAASMVDRPEL